ncbi:unannotated protein [freshwater metagenome]|uniref:tRNA(Ile)-lysidine synthetase n=2 Tax=freshwater metagenome TaxID=449393 RepID=A0A6J7V1X4_9ZZZZ|nr:tRNA lysidine(34) synthetase TilS [Actinomycetota bacterium]MSW25726.1 tRNA lysidine(34) synthetase TilS [Actinomycetota bacterium]MSW33458.1 tRNA lysidine(34) synthetase TilS [Actinomycetota bacterium]MSX30482.1 tRNA lysidine(34) synthetase TilS [Actinomycetota bacterium]MSY50475.1 tRNA lysidine(34) synthetase TilS [Actinomycetota bacterium]
MSPSTSESSPYDASQNSNKPSHAMVTIRSAVRGHLEMCKAGERVIVACSGGADSLALSFAIIKEAQKLALHVIGITIDHQLQKQSAQQGQRVMEQLQLMGIAESEVVKVAVNITDGVEASARRSRYEALDAAADKYGASRVFLGHTRDDQAETVLLGLARGSGTRSLSGMAIESGKYIRPLLAITRAQTVAACEEEGLDFWTDPHNSNSDFLRVRVRNEVLPVLEKEMGPGVSAALARSSALLRDDADALDAMAKELFSTLESQSMDIGVLSKLPRALRTRIIRMALYEAQAPQGSITAEHVSEIEALITSWHGQGALSMPGGVKVERISGRLSLLPPKP